MDMEPTTPIFIMVKFRAQNVAVFSEIVTQCHHPAGVDPAPAEHPQIGGRDPAAAEHPGEHLSYPAAAEHAINMAMIMETRISDLVNGRRFLMSVAIDSAQNILDHKTGCREQPPIKQLEVNTVVCKSAEITTTAISTLGRVLRLILALGMFAFLKKRYIAQIPEKSMENST